MSSESQHSISHSQQHPTPHSRACIAGEAHCKATAQRPANKNDEPQWFVIKVSHKEQKAIDVFDRAGIDTFCPMTKADITVRGEKTIVRRPLIANTIFAYGAFSKINSVKSSNPFITYSYAKSGSTYRILHVPDHEMKMFIDSATKMENDITYYRPDEVNLKKGDKVRIVGGLFDGYEGVLLKAKGRAKRVFLINFELLGALGTHVEAQYIRLIKD